MPVYMLIAEGETDKIKIGYAADVPRRVATLQTSTWRKLIVRRVIPGVRGSETWFHTRFRHLHVALEWFDFDPLMLTLTPDSSPRPAARIPNRSYANIPTPKAPTGFHADLIRSLGGTTKIAASMGLTKSVLSKWPVRGIPSKHWLRLIELANGAGIAVTAADLDRTKPDTMARAIAA